MQQLSDFSKAKVGDEVESFHYGKGHIVEIKLENTQPIKVRFGDSGMQTYTLDGKIYHTNVRSDLYYPGIPEFPVPERPKVKVKKTLWVNVYEDDSFTDGISCSSFPYKTKESAVGQIVHAKEYLGIRLIGTYPIEIEVEE